jgi:hypothetical protein
MNGALGWLAALVLLAPGATKETGAMKGHNGHVPEPIAPARMRVTEGALEARAKDSIRVDVPKMRMVVPGTEGASAELRFTYLGPTTERKTLASGQMREQLGLKLRAMDGCNVVYAMWRLAPKPELVVSIKRNPHEHSSGDCGNRGYTNIRPRTHAAVPALKPGDSHVLRAELHERALRVLVDGAPVWEGELPAEAFTFNGPVGMRSDNVRADFQLISLAPR